MNAEQRELASRLAALCAEVGGEMFRGQAKRLQEVTALAPANLTRFSTEPSVWWRNHAGAKD